MFTYNDERKQPRATLKGTNAASRYLRFAVDNYPGLIAFVFVSLCNLRLTKYID